jgi:hypothetical protein
MQPLDFLAAVLPSSGVYCACEFTTPKKEHVFVSSLDELLSTANTLDAKKLDAYFALANFAKAGNRTADNAKTVKSLFMDIDIGESTETKKKYATRKEAAEGFEKFMLETGMSELGQPFIVSSGGGFHVYWPFDEEIPITQWKPVAENFKRLCHQEGLVIDMNVPADAARVLRVPGTHNHKTESARVVKILVDNDKPFSFFAIDGFIRSKLKTQTYEQTVATLNLPGTKPKAATNASTVKLFENSETSFGLIVQKTEQGKGCGQIAHYIEHAKADGMEPLWRGMLSLAQKCDDGDEWAVKLSEMHPYEPARMAQKLREIKGPYPCLKLDSENPGICTNCPHFGKITNPLALGRVVATSTEAKEIEIPAPQGAEETAHSQPAIIKRPLAPRGFSYGKNGGVFKDAMVEDNEGNQSPKPIMLLPYDLFVVNILKQEEEHLIHMVALRPEGATEIIIPQKSIVSKDETAKHLASQNIIAAYGQGNDKNLYDYVRACVEEASTSRGVLKVPDSYGWQEGNSFVYNERIYTKGNAPFHIPMRNLANLNAICKPQGTIENWRKIMDMVIAKGLHDVLTMSLQGFAAPLMRFTGFAGVTWHMGSKDSGTGKTLSLHLTASIWGHPDYYPIALGTSDVAMKQRLGLLKSLPLLCDEVTDKNRNAPEWLPAFILSLSNGQGKERMEAGANKERVNTTRWSTHAFFTSNTHTLDYLDSRTHSSQGEILRILEVTPSTIITWTKQETATLHALKENHGIAGHLYTQWLVDNFDTAKEVYTEVYARIAEQLKFTNQERFWHAGCATIIAGGILAGKKYANIIDYPMGEIIKVLKGILDKARGVVTSNLKSAEDVLNAYTGEFYGKFVVVKALDGALAASLGEEGVIDQTITRSEICGRVEHGVTPGHVDYYIEERQIKQFCYTHSFGYSDFKKQMEEKYHVSYLKKDLMSKTKGPQMRVNAIRISRKVTKDGDEETNAEVSLEAA